MKKYRIKTKEYSFWHGIKTYSVQIKFKYFPVWITVKTYYNLRQAEQCIKERQGERENK